VRLLDLDPHWYVLKEGGPVVGLSFQCPHCPVDKATRLGIAFHHHGRAAMEDQYILAHHGADDTQHIWDLDSQDDFATLTLHPSIDASKSGHWHGFITNGVIT
jgi:hypothetical protein